MRSVLNRALSFLLLIPVIVGCGSPEDKKITDNEPRRVELLFLGHDAEHHPSGTYVPILASALTKDGINITYTEDVNDLNTENLSRYDGVILYANYEDRMPEQEEALMDYIAEGHAFIPLHCASFCFKDSDGYIDMVGGRFMSHETGTFTTEIVDQEHPILKEVAAFETWDETYKHDKVADDITVLMERVEGEHREPYTWVKNYGKGKVFYTAYGHDDRTWKNEGFQNLVRHGILWAVDENTKKNLLGFMKDVPTLVYEHRDSIPNYEKRDPAPQYQLPLSPSASAKLIQVPVGFNLELFAAEPDIINPIAMNWDERGRLWVIETVDYPNTVRDDKGSGDDLIKILEDTDKDGKADKVTVFADRLNLPTSFAFVNGGIVVSQAPHFLFLKDTDGDDKADVKEILIDGWGTFDTHAGPSNLQMGIDNKIYGVLGYSGFEGSIFGKDFKFAQGIYRFDRSYENFEFLTSTSNNTWGLGFTEGNSVFASTANNTHSVFMGIPNKYFEGVEGIIPQGSLKIDGHYDMKPITPNYRQVDVFGGFTAAAGHHFYTARNYPSSYWNKVAFVCEPTGGLVHISKIVKEGAGYLEKDGGNLFSSSDEWVSPVEAKVGPDGNVWVADWYNFIVQHNPTPRTDRGGYDAVNGKGNAYENPLRDKSRGRIWRIVPKQESETSDLVLEIEKPKQLVQTLSNDNMFWRMTAQRMLLERGKSDIINELYGLINNTEIDSEGLNPGALHALWTLVGLGVLDSDTDAINVVQDALLHPAPSVRKAAIQILPRNNRTDDILAKSKIMTDADPEVQLEALLYYAERPSSESLGNQLYALSLTPQIKNDPWLSKAVYVAASKHRVGFTNSFLKENPQSDTEEAPPLERYEIAYNDTKWESMTLPQKIEDAGVDIDGIIWFRKNITLTAAEVATSASISLGPVNDSDVVYINGKLVGTTQNSWEKPRMYKIGPGVLQAGKNSISIWVEDTGGGGGLWGEKEQLFLLLGNQRMSLAGVWKYDVEADYSGRSNVFATTSIAEVLYENYKGKPMSIVATREKDENAVVINMKTIVNEMKFDISEFVVEAGASVEVVFVNNDFMQHNLLILAQGSKEKVGAAADRLAQDPTGAEKSYVPNMPEVLHATAMVNPEQQVVLRFKAPTEPGEYPYICTFPGHWRIMQGVMKVVANPS